MTLDLGDAEVLTVTYELAGVRGDEILPAGLHPTVPTLLTIAARRGDGVQSVQLRVSCRAGFRARALLVGGVTHGGLAPQLIDGWAFPPERGTVVFERRYDRVRVVVRDGDCVVLDAGLDDPAPISVHDIQHVVSLHPGEVEGRGARLIQIEPHLDSTRAERGRPVLDTFDGAWFGDARLRPAHPVAATIEVGMLTLAPPRFAQRPDVPAWEGTELISP